MKAGLRPYFTFSFEIITFPCAASMAQGRWGTAALPWLLNIGSRDRVIAQQGTDPAQHVALHGCACDGAQLRV